MSFLPFFMLSPLFAEVVTRSEKKVDLLVVMEGAAVVVVAEVVLVEAICRRRPFRSDSLMRPLSPKILSIA